MNICHIEPFYSGSHKQFVDQLKDHSKHNFTLLTMDGKFWKWRMYGAAVTMAEQFNQLEVLPDLVLVSDMIDLSTFVSLTRKRLGDIPVVLYFHENQFFYPWQSDSEDVSQKRDVHYGMMNYQSALAADYICYNSSHNMMSFIDGVKSTLGKMPDYSHEAAIKSIESKSKVLHLGLELADSVDMACISPEIKNITSSDKATILWNHRLEHDKDPGLFFDMLLKLKTDNVAFELLLLGAQTKANKKPYKKALEALREDIIYQGFCPSKADYDYLLEQSDILPVTSKHDFFGISVAEAIHLGVQPLLPQSLSYVELYKPNENTELFYKDTESLYAQLKAFCQNYPHKKDSLVDYSHLTAQYNWSKQIHVYDAFFDSL